MKRAFCDHCDLPIHQEFEGKNKDQVSTVPLYYRGEDRHVMVVVNIAFADGEGEDICQGCFATALERFLEDFRKQYPSTGR